MENVWSDSCVAAMTDKDLKRKKVEERSEVVSNHPF